MVKRLLIAALLVCAPAWAQNTTTLAIGKVAPIPSLKTRMGAAGKSLSLDQAVETLDSQLIDRVNATRKFKVVAYSDLQQVIKAQDGAASGNYNLNDPNTAKQFQLAGIKYLLVTTVDDWEDQTQRMEQKLAGVVVTRRVLRLGVACRIFDTTTGALLESASHVLGSTNINETLKEITNDAEATDAGRRVLVQQAADWVAQRVADVAFPIRVLAKTDKQVTINRGDGTPIAVGQIYTANALGAELKDPDTGEVLGREEIQIGSVRVTEVTAKFSKAEVIEDNGIAAGAVLRLAKPRK